MNNVSSKMNMFARKVKASASQLTADEMNRKKCATKVLDLKKDVSSRLRYLKAYIDLCDNVTELKQFFDANYSQIYFIFYESFVNVESSLKQKLSKPNKEELETVLFVFQKILVLQPERVHQRWQVRSIGRIMQKLLHIGNAKFIKLQGMRLFLIWYQILNTNRTQVEELMFQKLVQGFDMLFYAANLFNTSSTSHQTSSSGNVLHHQPASLDLLNAEVQKVFNSPFESSSSNQSTTMASNNTSSSFYTGRSIYSFEITPIIPQQAIGEQQSNDQQPQFDSDSFSSSSSSATPSNTNPTSSTNSSGLGGASSMSTTSSSISSNSVFSLTAELVRNMLEFMQHDCLMIEWHGDRLIMSQRCFEFLFDEFKRFYLSHMFPNAFLLISQRSSSSSSSSNMPVSALNVFSSVDLLHLINEQPVPSFDKSLITQIPNMSEEKRQAQLHCKEEIIKWLISSVLLIEIAPSLDNKSSQFGSQQSSGFVDDQHSMSTISSLIGSMSTVSTTSINTLTSSNADLASSIVSRSATINDSTTESNKENEEFEFDVDLKMPPTSSLSGSSTKSSAQSKLIYKQLAQRVMLCNLNNINLVHEIIRNVYFLSFDDSNTVKLVLEAYKKWFLREARTPLFMQDSSAGSLLSDTSSVTQEDEHDTASLNQQNRTASVSSTTSSVFSYSQYPSSSFHSSVDQYRIGYVRCLQIFYYHSSHLLLNKANFSKDKIKNVCCHLLDIYKLFIKKIKMDHYTWSMIITILLRVSEFVFNSEQLMSSQRASDPATSQLIKLITETLLLAMIKASFSFNLDANLWDELMRLLSLVSSNQDVVDKWIDSIDDLIRQVLKYIYNVDINNMPVSNESDPKRKLKKKMLNGNNTTTNATPTTTNQYEQSPLFPLRSAQNQAGATGYKPRSRTEIYSSAVLSSLGVSTSSTTTTSASQSSNRTGNSVSSSTTTPNSTNTPAVAVVSSTASQSQQNPLLTRQRNFTITNSDLGSGNIANSASSIKSPSLSDEHFVAINKSPRSINSASNKSEYLGLESSGASINLANASIVEEVASGDVETSLKPVDTDTTDNPLINRVCSDKSIYYSSEAVNKSVNEDEESGSYQASAYSSPQHQQNGKDGPPPLPPLPPSLASRIISSFNKPIQVETEEIKQLDSLKDYLNTTPLGQKVKQRGMDTASSDGGTSLSGGELSGDTFASPNANNNQDTDSIQSGQLIFDQTGHQTSSGGGLLVQAVALENGSLNSSGNSREGSTGVSELLVKHDERTASFIDTKYLDQASRASTLTNIKAQVTETSKTTTGQVTAATTSMLAFKQTAYALIKRLFGCLDNINAIKDPNVHRKVVEFIYTKWERLTRLKDDLKLADLSQTILPLSYFSAWLFQCIYQLPPGYLSGKLIAYKTLCRMAIKSALSVTGESSSTGTLTLISDTFDHVNEDFMDLFYLTLHHGLRSDDKSTVNCIIQTCNTRFWHCMMPSSTLLVRDFIDACTSLDSAGPKLEAASILGCLIAYPDYFGDLKVFVATPVSSSPKKPSSDESTLPGDELNIEQLNKEDLKTLIVHSLATFSDDPSNVNSRCVILCSLTCFIFDEIYNQKWNAKRLNDAIKRIFRDLESKENSNLVLVKMSCDNLRFLSCLAGLIFQKDIQYAINIINELNQCLVKLINSKPSLITEDYEKAIISNMFALLEWCMSMPLDQLKDQDRATLLKNNFKLITHICATFKPNESYEAEHIHLSARFIISHLLNQLNFFPYGPTGPAKIVSSVNELSDLNLGLDELSTSLFEQNNIQFFSVNSQFLISFIELPMRDNEKYFSPGVNLKCSTTLCRLVVRDFCGKTCWDSCLLHSPDQLLPRVNFLDIPVSESDLDNVVSMPTTTTATQINNEIDFTRLPYLNANEMPKDADLLEKTLDYINYSSPECRLVANKSLNLVSDLHPTLSQYLGIDELKQKLVAQSKIEQEHAQNQLDAQLSNLTELTTQAATNSETDETNPEASDLHTYFHLCKSLVHQLGLLSWEKRQSFNLLHKSSQLLRELKSLDDQTCRETHKVALIYIGEGQEDKQSILSNEKGSPDYEDFLSALAWQIDLEAHEGFMGGLQHNYQLKTAPYYANSICECLFHVSTQMSSQTNDQISKWRHLGNDSVQIIWSDHSKDYDRSILSTEFADVIICIYPLRISNLFRIQIVKKQSVGIFGPLFDGAIVNKNVLPALIRATAINASRVLLSNTRGYQDFYVHRAHAISNIIKTLSEKQTFEQFVVDLYSPSTLSTTSSTTAKKDDQLPVDPYKSTF